jgi:hypothetical protein
MADTEVPAVGAHDHGCANQLVAGVEVDTQTIYGLRLYVAGLEGAVAALRMPSTAAGVVLRIGADVEVTALAAWAGEYGRLWREARESVSRAAVRVAVLAAAGRVSQRAGIGARL